MNDIYRDLASKLYDVNYDDVTPVQRAEAKRIALIYCYDKNAANIVAMNLRCNRLGESNVSIKVELNLDTNEIKVSN